MPYAVAADGIRIHYEVTGITKRAPVLLVQGLGGEKNSWNLQRAALALRHRTVAFDNRGAGKSDKPEGTYDLEQMADDAIAVEKELENLSNVTHIMSFIGRTHGVYNDEVIGTIDYLEKPGKLVEKFTKEQLEFNLYNDQLKNLLLFLNILLILTRLVP